MKLYCMVNPLKKEHIKDYQDYHENAHKAEWKTQIAALKEAGAEVCNVYLWNGYSVVIMGCDDLDACLSRLSQSEDNQKWQRVMGGFFDAQPNFDGDGTVTALKIFDLGEQAQGYLDQE